jgi:NAD(P)-dependent dehydrogenase (short-subunit alcohol dehydrogenase family)
MKTYVITGCTSGIGKALAEHFSKDGIVFAGYRNEGKKHILEKQNIIPFYIDYSKPETIPSAIEFIKTQTSKIDTLINVAGCVVAGAMENISIKELKRQFDVNVFGHIEFSQGLLELLDDGKIINISSMSSYGIYPFIAPYCASKRALDILFNCFSLETKQNIKVISVKPGAISTPIWSKSLEENKETIDNCSSDYQKETTYLKKNALKNEEKGLPVNKVVQTISKIDSSKNPKPSYCVGADSLFTSIISRLPQSMLNKLIKLKLTQIK